MGQRDEQIPPQRAGVQELRGLGHRGSQPKMAWDGGAPGGQHSRSREE